MAAHIVNECCLFNQANLPAHLLDLGTVINNVLLDQFGESFWSHHRLCDLSYLIFLSEEGIVVFLICRHLQ